MHKFCIETTKTYTKLLDYHIAYYFNINKTFVNITPDIPRLFMFVILFHHILSTNWTNVPSPSSKNTWVSEIIWGYTYLYFYIVYPVVYRLTLTQCQNICTIFHRLFWETYQSLVLLALCHQHHFSREKHITSKGQSDILEILILKFDFLYFDVNIL